MPDRNKKWETWNGPLREWSEGYGSVVTNLARLQYNRLTSRPCRKTSWRVGRWRFSEAGTWSRTEDDEEVWEARKESAEMDDRFCRSVVDSSTQSLTEIFPCHLATPPPSPSSHYSSCARIPENYWICIAYIKLGQRMPLALRDELPKAYSCNQGSQKSKAVKFEANYTEYFRYRKAEWYTIPDFRESSSFFLRKWGKLRIGKPLLEYSNIRWLSFTKLLSCIYKLFYVFLIFLDSR